MSSPGSEKKSIFNPPTFYKPLCDLSTSEGECLVLECRVKGVPPPKIVWKREGCEIEDSPDFRMLHRGEVVTLVIGEAFPEDSGIFTCEATNKAGFTFTACKVVVKGGSRHTVSTKSAASAKALQHPRPAQVLPAHQVTSCPVTSPLASSSNSHSASPRTCVSQFHLTPRNPKFNGDFERNRALQSDSVTSRNDVTSPSSPPACNQACRHLPSDFDSACGNSISSSGTSMATASINSSPYGEEEGDNFKEEKNELIQAVAQSFKEPKQHKPRGYNSSRELAKIERDIELRQQTLSDLSTLALDNKPNGQDYKVSTFDERLINEIEYRLQRTAPVIEDQEDGMFENVPEPQQTAPSFSTRLKNFRAVDGTSPKFTCRVSAKPTAKVFWFKDGKQISKRSQHYLQRAGGDGEYELYIPQLHVDDDGNYTALATNPKGRVCCTGRLVVVSSRQHALPNDVTSSVVVNSKQRLPAKGELADDEESPVEKYYRPTFIQKPPENVKSEEGKLVRLDVKVTGLPLPDIEWLINGKPVRPDPLHKILVRENNVHSLLLDRVSPMDEGNYTIRASNKAGAAEANVQLHVAHREQMSAPAFIQRLSGQCVAEGQPIRLEARVVGAPRPTITWKRGSDQVMQDSRICLYEDETGYVCLQINQTRQSDAAWYTCSATNKAGISSCNCKLDVYSTSSNAPSSHRRIRTPQRYANLAKVAGVDMREALSPEPPRALPESEEL